MKAQVLVLAAVITVVLAVIGYAPGPDGPGGCCPAPPPASTAPLAAS